MDTQLIAQLGDELYDALKACKPIVPFTDRYKDISIDEIRFKYMFRIA